MGTWFCALDCCAEVLSVLDWRRQSCGPWAAVDQFFGGRLLTSYHLGVYRILDAARHVRTQQMVPSIAWLATCSALGTKRDPLVFFGADASRAVSQAFLHVEKVTAH